VLPPADFESAASTDFAIPGSGTSVHAAYSEVSAVQASSPFRRRSASTAMHVPQTATRMGTHKFVLAIGIALLAALAWPAYDEWAWWRFKADHACELLPPNAVDAPGRPAHAGHNTKHSAMTALSRGTVPLQVGYQRKMGCI
jgi:hypothetical protein